jgi:patatin-like phospholipase/acyl hydrolase
MLDAFYATEDPNLHNVDVMTDVSMAPTAFTRYTVAPSTASKASKFVDSLSSALDFILRVLEQTKLAFQTKAREEGWFWQERDCRRGGVPSQILD